MATQASMDIVQKAYLAYYGRPADPNGLNFWATKLDNDGGSFDALIDAFGNSAEATELFGGKSAAETVNTLYNQILGRDADLAGLNFYVLGLQNGDFSAASIAQNIFDGAQNDDATLLANKLAVAKAFTASLDTVAEILAYAGSAAAETARDLLATVTVDTVTADFDVETTVAGLAGATVANGTTFTLTTSIDVFNGTSGNDTLIGDAATASAADSFNGGNGLDTFQLVGGTDADVITTSSVEVYEFKNQAAMTGNAVDLSGVADLTTLKLNNSVTGQTYTVGNDVAVEITNMAAGEAVTIGSAATNLVHNLTVGSLDVAKAGTVTVNANGANVGTINLATVDGSYSDVTLASDGAEKTVNVTGSGELDLKYANSVTTLDASAATGNITLADPTATGNTTIKTGSGKDSVTAAAAVNYTIDLGAGDDKLTTGNLTADDSIAAGEGNDTLAVAFAAADALDADTAASKAILAKITGFEVLELTDDMTGAIAMNKLGYNSLVLAAGTSAGTVTGVTSGFTVTYTDTVTDADDVLTVTMTDATLANTQNDTLNVVLKANIANNATVDVGDISVAGINKITIDASDASNADLATNKDDGYSIGLTNGTVVDTVTVTGSSELTYTVVAGQASMATYDASASTGNQIFVGTAHNGNQGITITTGTGDDNITSTAVGDVITTGAGKDKVTVIDDAVKTQITDFTFGTGGDSLTVDVSAIGSAVIGGDGLDDVAAQALVFNEIAGKETVAAGDNLFVLTGATYATTALVKAAIVAGGAREITLAGAATANDDILVAYSDGTDSYIAVVNINNAATTIDDNAATTVTNFIQLTGVNVSVAGTVHADNFAALV